MLSTIRISAPTTLLTLLVILRRSFTSRMIRAADGIDLHIVSFRQSSLTKRADQRDSQETEEFE